MKESQDWSKDLFEGKKAEESTLEKIEHSIADTLTAAKDLIAEPITAAKDLLSDTFEAFKEKIIGASTAFENPEADLRTQEEKFKATL